MTQALWVNITATSAYPSTINFNRGRDIRRVADVVCHILTTEIENNKENKRGNVHEGGLLSFNLVPTRGGQVIFFRKKPPKRLSG